MHVELTPDISVPTITLKKMVLDISNPLLLVFALN